jgi:hypothetical protein
MPATPPPLLPPPPGGTTIDPDPPLPVGPEGALSSSSSPELDPHPNANAMHDTVISREHTDHFDRFDIA